MPIKGIGVDLENISRFKNKPFNKNKNFYKRIFTKKEIEYCLKKPNPYQHFTARFCAKEAFIKALNNDIKSYKSIEIEAKNKKPLLRWKGKSFLVSMSHDKEKAIAVVIVGH